MCMSGTHAVSIHNATRRCIGVPPAQVCAMRIQCARNVYAVGHAQREPSCECGERQRRDIPRELSREDATLPPPRCGVSAARHGEGTPGAHLGAARNPNPSRARARFGTEIGSSRSVSGVPSGAPASARRAVNDANCASTLRYLAVVRFCGVAFPVFGPRHREAPRWAACCMDALRHPGGLDCAQEQVEAP